MTEYKLLDGTVRVGDQVWYTTPTAWAGGVCDGILPPSDGGSVRVAVRRADGSLVAPNWYDCHLSEGGAKESLRGALKAQVELHEQQVAAAKEAYRAAGFVPEREEPAYLEGLKHG